jgi:hypothetical protein
LDKARIVERRRRHLVGIADLDRTAVGQRPATVRLDPPASPALAWMRIYPLLASGPVVDTLAPLFSQVA